MNKDYYIGLMYKKLKNEISVDESAELEQFISEDKENEDLYNEIRLTWELAGSETIISDNELMMDLNTLNKKIEKTEKKVIPLRNIFIQLAAAVIILFGAVIVIQQFLNNQNIEIFADSVKEVELPDGSNLWLAKGSSLSYRKNFTSDRIIHLEGMAKFEVEKDPEHPFVVNVNKTSVTVLGTIFTIDGLDSKTIVSVEEGSVQLDNNESSLILTKNQIGIFDNINSIPVRRDLNTQNFDYWIEEQFRFDKLTLSEVMQELSIIFNAIIEIKNADMMKCEISGVINSVKLEDILERISNEFSLNIVSVSENEFILENGSCP